MGYNETTVIIYIIEYNVNIVSISSSIIVLIKLLKAILKAVISL